MRLPDGPKFPALLQTLQIIAQPTQFLEQCANRFGDCFTLRVLGFKSPPIIFFSHPKAIETIFNTDANKFELGKITHVFKPLTGSQSLIMQDGKRHHRLRKLLMPPLHSKQLPAYGQTICNLTIQATQSWSPGASISIRDYTAKIALEVILKVVLGLPKNQRYLHLKSLIEDYLEGVNKPLNSVQFFLPPLQQNLGRWSPWGKFIEKRQKIDELIYAEIAERRIKPLGDDVLSLLISAQDETGKTLNDQELRDQLITLLLLGYDTTASALAWAFYWVHRYPNILDRLVQELNSLGENPDPMEISQLPYLQAVCQETLRIHPIALISQPRVVKETVKIDNYQFESGTILVPCIHLAHHRSEVYPNSKQFNPNRFLDRKLSPYEYFPFGGGNRSCIGMALSMFEMKLILATILLNYQLAFNPNHVVKAVRRGITIVPSNNFRLTVLTGRNIENYTQAINL